MNILASEVILTKPECLMCGDRFFIPRKFGRAVAYSIVKDVDYGYLSKPLIACSGRFKRRIDPVFYSLSAVDDFFADKVLFMLDTGSVIAVPRDSDIYVCHVNIDCLNDYLLY